MITDTQLRKVVLWVAKIATLVISAPATIGVVGAAYEGMDTPAIVVVLVQIASLLVVEGAFLYFWQLVEDTRNLQTKEEREQNTYVGAAWAMYFLLLAVGILHGEGAVTFIIRFAMGLLLFVATNDKLSAMAKKYEEDRIKGKRKTRKERTKEAQAEEQVSLALIEAKKLAQIKAITEQTDLLNRTSEQLIVHRILLSLPAPSTEVVEGEIVADESVDNPQPQSVVSTQPEEEPIKELQTIEENKEAETSVYDNGSYRIVKKGNDFVVSCYLCDYQDVKLGSASSSAYTSAVRAGSKHMGKHKTKKREAELEDNSGFR